MNSYLKSWIQQNCSFSLDALEEIPGDASFRRYFRLYSGKQTYIAMDASQQMDSFEPFIAIAQALARLNVRVPEIIAHDFVQGFMIISDFGDALYLKELGPENVDLLYQTAMDSLFIVQGCHNIQNWVLPHFDQAFMQRELKEFNDWFLEGYLKVAISVHDRGMLQKVFTQLCESAGRQIQVFIHRDYHSANLMVLPENQVGILDFQDAGWGPITYDLVSLLRDCYIDWPQEKVQGWVNDYYSRLKEGRFLSSVSFDQFLLWFDWMGMQRHMKALFIFARKYLRDHTRRYLSVMPRTLNYIQTISEQYPELSAFHQFVSERLVPALTCEDNTKVVGIIK